MPQTNTFSRLFRMHKNLCKQKPPSIIHESGFCGGEAGIRTRARVTPTNGLANRPLQPTWVLLHIYMLYPVSLYSVYEANHERYDTPLILRLHLTQWRRE